MDGSISIGRIFGIPIKLHLTFLVILPLFVYVFSEADIEILDIPLGFGGFEASTTVRYAFGTVAAVLFFAAILAHELAHSLLALRYGVRIKSITLMLFGGVASMEEVPRRPGEEWRMAFAGPLTSFIIGAVSLALFLLLGRFTVDSVAFEGVTVLVGLLGFYNVVLGIFNLVPAFPMDGGRLLRSYYVSKMSYVEATRKAARVGRYFAIGMGLVGLLSFNLILILIAFIVYMGASEEEQSTVISESLSGVTVRQVMTSSVEVIHPDISVQQLLDLMLATRHMGFPVVELGLVGIVTLSDVQKVPRDQLALTRVRSIMTRDVVTVEPDRSAADALKLMSERKIGRLIVIERGRIVGIVTRKDFLQAVEVLSKRSQWGYRPPPSQMPPGSVPYHGPPQQQPPSPPTASS